MSTITIRMPRIRFYWLTHLLTYIRTLKARKELLKASRDLVKAQDRYKQAMGYHKLQCAILQDSVNKIKAGEL